MSRKGFWTRDTYMGEWRWPLYTLVATITTVVIALIVIGCVILSDYNETRKTDRGRGDSPVTGVIQEPAEGQEIIAIEMPDEFSGLATRCVWEGYRGFSSTGDGGVSVVPDPECPMPEVVDIEDAHR